MQPDQRYSCGMAPDIQGSSGTTASAAEAGGAFGLGGGSPPGHSIFGHHIINTGAAAATNIINSSSGASNTPNINIIPSLLSQLTREHQLLHHPNLQQQQQLQYVLSQEDHHHLSTNVQQQQQRAVMNMSSGSSGSLHQQQQQQRHHHLLLLSQSAASAPLGSQQFLQQPPSLGFSSHSAAFQQLHPASPVRATPSPATAAVPHPFLHQLATVQQQQQQQQQLSSPKGLSLAMKAPGAHLIGGLPSLSPYQPDSNHLMQLTPHLPALTGSHGISFHGSSITRPAPTLPAVAAAAPTSTADEATVLRAHADHHIISTVGGMKWRTSRSDAQGLEVALLKSHSEILMESGRTLTIKNAGGGGGGGGGGAGLWEEVSRKLQEMGYSMSASQCMEKYENIQRMYSSKHDGKDHYGSISENNVETPNNMTTTSNHHNKIVINNTTNDNSSASNGSMNQHKEIVAHGVSLTKNYNALNMSSESSKEEKEHDVVDSRKDDKEEIGEEEEQQQQQTNQEEEKLQEEEEGDEEEEDNEQHGGHDEGEDEGEGVQYKKKKKRRRIVEEQVGACDDYAQRRKFSNHSPSRTFFEKLTRQIMDKQETLHKVFLDTIEKRERERMMRDEAYRRQETARLNREQQIRAQEVALTAARDAALISFLQKASGHELQITAISPHDVTSKFGTLIMSSKETNPLHQHEAHLASTHPNSNVLSANDVDDKLDTSSGGDLNTRRWPKVEVHALIRLRSGMEPRFREAGPKAHLWQEISTSMACMGFTRSPKRCKEKWENINKYFKKTKDSSKKRPENAKTCPYFHQLDTLYQRGILASSSTHTHHGSVGGQHLLIEANDQQSQQKLLEYHPSQNMDNIDDGKIVTLDKVLVDHHDNSSSCFDAPSSTNHDSSLSSMRMSKSKSLQMDMFVKDILELQQQQHQKLVDEYDRMEQAQELRELSERQQHQQQHHHHHHHHHLQHHESSSHPSIVHDNSTLMALVHKLTGDSSDLTMSAPSSMD